jgi:hypothetical protein
MKINEVIVNEIPLAKIGQSIKQGFRTFKRQRQARSAKKDIKTIANDLNKDWLEISADKLVNDPMMRNPVRRGPAYAKALATFLQQETGADAQTIQRALGQSQVATGRDEQDLENRAFKAIEIVSKIEMDPLKQTGASPEAQNIAKQLATQIKDPEDLMTAAQLLMKAAQAKSGA